MLVGLVEQIQNLDRSQANARTGVAARSQPLVCASGRRRWALQSPQFGDRLAVPGDDNLLALQRAVDQLWKGVLGFGYTIGGQVGPPQNTAIYIAILRPAYRRGITS